MKDLDLSDFEDYDSSDDWQPENECESIPCLTRKRNFAEMESGTMTRFPKKILGSITNRTRKRKKNKGKSSQYRGVCLDNRNGKRWLGYIWYHKRRIYIGYFEDEKVAAEAVNHKCLEIGIPIWNPGLEAVAAEKHRIMKSNKGRTSPKQEPVEIYAKTEPDLPKPKRKKQRKATAQKVSQALPQPSQKHPKAKLQKKKQKKKQPTKLTLKKQMTKKKPKIVDKQGWRMVLKEVVRNTARHARVVQLLESQYFKEEWVEFLHARDLTPFGLEFKEACKFLAKVAFNANVRLIYA